MPEQRAVVAELGRVRAEIEKRWKYIHDGSRPAHRSELYDLDADPAEQTNAAGDQAERVARFVENLAAFEAHHHRERAPKRIDISPEQLDALEELGYVN